MPIRRSAISALCTQGWLLWLVSCGHSPTAVSPVATLSGIVTETAPTENTPVSGVVVQVVGGDGQGASTATDAQGRFSIASPSGGVDLQLSRDGYVTRTAHVTVPGDGSSVALRVAPAPGLVTNTTGTGNLLAFKSVVVPVHHPGEVTITDVSFYGFEEGDSLTFEVLDGGRLIAATTLERSFPRNTVALRAFVAGGQMVEVRATCCWTYLTFTHPR